MIEDNDPLLGDAKRTYIIDEKGATALAAMAMRVHMTGDCSDVMSTLTMILDRMGFDIKAFIDRLSALAVKEATDGDGS